MKLICAALLALTLIGCEAVERISEGECRWVRHGQQGWYVDCLDGSPGWPIGKPTVERAE